jgi:hypothetical protein
MPYLYQTITDKADMQSWPAEFPTAIIARADRLEVSVEALPAEVGVLTLAFADVLTRLGQLGRLVVPPIRATIRHTYARSIGSS